MFAVYDAKAEMYRTPFFAPNTAEALRSWQHLTTTEENEITSWPEDFTLFELGEVELENAEYKARQVPLSLGNALQARAAMQNARKRTAEALQNGAQ